MIKLTDEEAAAKERRETPREFEARTGRPWGDDSGVYMKVGKNGWRLKTYRDAKFIAECCNGGNGDGKVSYKIY